MTKITKEEVLKLARSSRIRLHENEIDAVIEQLESFLTYAERVQEIAADIEEPSNKNVNVFKEDVVKGTSPEPILEQAPERESDFFVVPAILDTK